MIILKTFGLGRKGRPKGDAPPVDTAHPDALFVDPPVQEAYADYDHGATESSLDQGLAAYDLHKSFKSRNVVRGASLSVRPGEAVGLLGPNGAGKTTIFYMITGLIPADAGRIELNGQVITRLPMYRRARLGIGYLPQEPSIFRGLNAAEHSRGA